MCGITGVISLGGKSIDTKNIKAMCDIISHRGPDDAGYFLAQTGRQHKRKQIFFERFTDTKFQHITPMLPAIDTEYGQASLHAHQWDIFLGHRRLAIIDISSAGHQPMGDLSQSVWVVYNGEIYNFKEIRKELEKLGYELVTQSDTEVLIYAYHAWGIECIHKFNGMFAFALWDKRNQLFYLVRDRYGIKPLYYKLLDTGELIFASEVKSVLQYVDAGRSEIDHEALLEYFTFQNIFTDKTLYQNVTLLKPGHYIEINLNDTHPQLDTQQYWDFSFKEPAKIKDEREYIEELDRLFVQAVKRQLTSDVEVGSYLSGGMDSGSICAVAAKHIPYLKTFTVGFDLNNVSGIELSFDEREKAELMSYKFKTEHYEMVLKSGDMERCLPNFAWHIEEPRVGQSYPNYYAAKLAGKFVKVVLSGAGGDELFAGYPWRYYRAVNNNGFEDYIDKYYVFWKRLLDNKQLQALFSPIKDKVSQVWTRDIFRDVFLHHKNELQTPEDYVNHSLYFEAKTFLHGLLVVEDKLSMAHSLEMRVPFLDNDLIDFSMNIPVNYKLGNLKDVIRIDENEYGNKAKKYFEKTNDGKVILRKALGKYMPEGISKATKQGFSSPDDSWFRGDSIEFVKKKLLDDKNDIYKYFDRHALQNIISEHLSGNTNRRLFIWSLLNFSAWQSHYGV